LRPCARFHFGVVPLCELVQHLNQGFVALFAVGGVEREHERAADVVLVNLVQKASAEGEEVPDLFAARPSEGLTRMPGGHLHQVIMCDPFATNFLKIRVAAGFYSRPFVLRQLGPEGRVIGDHDVDQTLQGEVAPIGLLCHIPRWVSISADVSTPDGGVDASILEDGGGKFQDDELLSSGRRFQIKTGDFQPWQPATIKRELFGTKPKKIENLGAAIQRTLREGKEFVLVCFGVDPVDEK
jgi:hypothetical protein